MATQSQQQPMKSNFTEFTAEEMGTARPDLSVRIASHARLATTVLAAVSGLVIMATTGDSLRTYNATNLGQEYNLPIWPTSFDLRPTIATLACGAIIFLASAVSLVGMFLPMIKTHPTSPLAKTLAFAPSIISLIAAIISTAFFYSTNASSSTWSLKSWSCQWSNITTSTAPHWDTLCHESKVGIYLSVVIIPLEVYKCCLAAWVIYKEKRVVGQGWERKSSQDLS